MATLKQTPLTVENFQKLFMEGINDKFSDIDGKFEGINQQFKSLRKDLTKLAHTVNNLKETVEETNEKVKYLPTTEVYLASQDKLMGELKTSEVETGLTGQHYKDVTKRIEYIDNFLQIDSSLT